MSRRRARWRSGGWSYAGHPWVRAAIVGLAVVAAAGVAALTATAAVTELGAPPPGQFTLTPELRMVIKYAEGFPSPGNPPPGNRPTVDANAAVLYTDSNGHCTIGWGHLDLGCDQRQWTFEHANRQLDADIMQQAMDPLNHCVATINEIRTNAKLPALQLTAGQMRALADLVFNLGYNRTVNKRILGYVGSGRHRRQVVKKILACQGPVATGLEAKAYSVPTILTLARTAYHATGRRLSEEIWDATNPTDGVPPTNGLPREARWDIATEIQPRRAAAEITIAPTGQFDPLVGQSPTSDDATVCARTAHPQKLCGKFYPDEQVKITAQATNSSWQFVRWKAVDTNGAAAFRDLCAATQADAQSPSCTVSVQDQLVRAIAVFKKTSCPVPGSARAAALASRSGASAARLQGVAARSSAAQSCGYEMTYSSGGGPGAGYSETYSATSPGLLPQQENGDFTWDQTVSYEYAPAAHGRYTLTQKYTYAGSGSSQDTQGANVISSCSITIPSGTGYTEGGPQSLPVKYPASVTFPWSLSEPPVPDHSTTSGCGGQFGFTRSYGLPYPADPDMNGLFSVTDRQAFSHVLAGSIKVPVANIPCELPMDFVDQKTDYSAFSEPGLSQTIDLQFHGRLTITQAGATSAGAGHSAAVSEPMC